MKMSRILVAVVACGLGLSSAWAGGEKAPKAFTITTGSEEARSTLGELQRRIESFQGGPTNAELAKKIVAADPAFALGTYYLSAVTPPPDNQKNLEKAMELAKAASDGERRLIEAMVLARGKTPEQAIEPLTRLAADYPGERIVHVFLGQNLFGQGRYAEARASFEKANAIDAATPRAYALIGNTLLMEGQYAKAREAYTSARTRIPPRVPGGFAAYNTAYSFLYEGKPDEAIKVLRAYVDEYRNSDPIGNLPEVFIWNSIARINLENGRYDEALKAYEQGFQSVPASKLSEEDKTIWLGRLHHGRGRTLARLGKHEDAAKEAETLKKMIDEGGERGKQFIPAFHYMSGYLKLEAGDYAAAIEDLKQADPDNPFHRLLLARAYEKAGDKANAKKVYQEVVDSKQNSLERALAWPEAKKKLQTL